MSNPYRSLQLTEARQRFEQLQVTAYDVRLDLATDEQTFRSVTTIRFVSEGGPTFADIKPVRVDEVRLNGQALDPADVVRGRLALETQPGDNELVVDAIMSFRNDGEGLHRSVDPADGKPYVYAMCFMDAAPSIFACFDQPDLKAPYTLHVSTPADWTVFANSPGTQVEPGHWDFEQTPPLSTYFVTLVAGPWHVLTDQHDGIPLGLSSRASIAKHLDADADELFTLTRQSFDELHRLFGIRYAFGSYHQAFVPEFNAAAMENPGCITIRDPYVFTSHVTRSERIRRAVTIAHEMAHQWFGNLTTPRWWDDLWLNESFAEYMGSRVIADATEYADSWTYTAWVRHQWGLVADQRPTTHPVAGNGAVDATAALQDFDGISYAKGASILRQLNARMGDEVFFEGVIDHFDRHLFGNASMQDLVASWERAGAGDLGSFVDNWLLTAGPDRITYDRDAGILRCEPPPRHPAKRSHQVQAALARVGGPWRLVPLAIDEPETPLDVAADEAVVIDPEVATWALVLPDETTMASLPELLPRTENALVRAAIWSGVRSALHNAELAPDAVLELVAAAIPVEDNDDGLRSTVQWALTKVAALTPDRESALTVIHRACRERLDTAPRGSTTQLAALQWAIASATDPELVQRWRSGEGLPDGIELDLELRWAMLVRLAQSGDVDHDELDRELAAEPTKVSQAEHARAVASLPTSDAKAWAWQRFTGEVSASNYELAAIGTGLWRPGQESLTEPYVDRYFAELPEAPSVHAGWVLGDVTEAFFPITSLRTETADAAQRLADRSGLDLTIRRNLLDCADELRRRIAVREKYAGTP